MTCLFCGDSAHGGTDEPKADVVVKRIEAHDGELLMTFEDLNHTGLFGIIIDSMVQAFRAIPGAQNCAEWRLYHEPSGEHFSLIVQRARGKTPLQLHGESMADLRIERAISDFWEAEARRRIRPETPHQTWSRWGGRLGAVQQWGSNIVPHIVWWHAHRREDR